MEDKKDKVPTAESGTCMCRLYKTTIEKVRQHRGQKPIVVFLDEAVDEYIRTTASKGMYDRITNIEAAQKKIELSSETTLGLLVNALSKLNLMSDEKK